MAVRSVEIPSRPDGDERPGLERLLAGSPLLTGGLTSLVARRPASSRLRRRILSETFAHAFAAIGRRDFWFVPLAYEPDCEIRTTGEWAAIGMGTGYRGFDGWHQMMEDSLDVFPDLRWQPQRFIDLGDRWLLQAVISASGAASGVPTTQLIGSVYRISRRGRIARQDLHYTWAGALAAEGLEATSDPPGAMRPTGRQEDW